MFDYPRKYQMTDMISTILMLTSGTDNKSSDHLFWKAKGSKLPDTCACIESIVLGSYLFEHVEDSQSLLKSVPFSFLISKKFSKKNTMLSADFFYSQAANISVGLGTDLEIHLLSRINEVNFRVRYTIKT